LESDSSDDGYNDGSLLNNAGTSGFHSLHPLGAFMQNPQPPAPIRSEGPTRAVEESRNSTESSEPVVIDLEDDD
jgi:hypothetical protein